MALGITELLAALRMSRLSAAGGAAARWPWSLW